MRIAMIAFTNIEYTIELVEGLATYENVLMMIPESQLNRFQSVIKKKVKTYGFFYPRIRSFKNLYMIITIIRKLKEFNPDIIHIQKGHPWFNLFLFTLKNYCIVTTIHDPILLDWPSKRIPEFTYTPPIKHAKRKIVHGNKLKIEMMEKYKSNGDDIHVLPRGVNSIYTRYIDKPIKEEQYTIMYFGRIWGYKGIKYLIEAEPIISEKVPELKIIIAGTGENMQKYFQLIKNRERFDIYNEFITNELVAELFQRACLVVLPYTRGSQSGVIPQAYAFGKPVIVTNVGSLPEAVVPDKTGKIIEPRDVESLANVIIDLLLNKEKRKKYGENALNMTKNELDWENIANDTIKIYKMAKSESTK